MPFITLTRRRPNDPPVHINTNRIITVAPYSAGGTSIRFDVLGAGEKPMPYQVLVKEDHDQVLRLIKEAE